MGFLIPESQVPVLTRQQLREQVKSALLARAMQQTQKPASEFVVRDIFPKDDLGFNTSAWENQTAIAAADTWTQDFTKELGKNTFVAFYGIIDHSVGTKPAADAAEGRPIKGVKLALGANGTTVKEQLHLQIADEENHLTSGFVKHPVGYFKPVYYDGGDTIYVAFIANAAVLQYAGAIELIGLVCEPYGNVISSLQVPNLAVPDNSSHVLPEPDMTIEDINNLREQLRTQLIALAAKETGKSPAEFIVRDIFPKDDLGFNGVEWQNQTAITAADTWTQDFTKELPKAQFMGFYGVQFQTAVAAMAAQKYKGVKYRLGTNGATTIKAVAMEKCVRGEMVSVGPVKAIRAYHSPVMYKGGDVINIQYLADATTTQYYDGIGLLGLVVEPIGSTISGA